MLESKIDIDGVTYTAYPGVARGWSISLERGPMLVIQIEFQGASQGFVCSPEPDIFAKFGDVFGMDEFQPSGKAVCAIYKNGRGTGMGNYIDGLSPLNNPTNVVWRFGKP